MRLISWNVNGIRAVDRKGHLTPFLEEYDPSILLIQETKASPDKLSGSLINHSDYSQFYHSADKAGYSGTSIWIKKYVFPEVDFSTGMPDFDDTEGRIAKITFDNYSIFSVYFPNGGKSPEAWQNKLVFYEKFLDYVNSLRDNGEDVIWAGDVNCAHEEIDLARPKENQDSIGFLPEERAWVSKVINNSWVDVFRQTFPTKVCYSWWHYLSKSRERNVGWRIDYFFVDELFYSKVKGIDYLNSQMGSDHCPVLMEI